MKSILIDKKRQINAHAPEVLKNAIPDNISDEKNGLSFWLTRYSAS